MSGTQATMNVRIGADISPLQQGLKQGEQAIAQSAKAMGTAITKAAPTQADGSSVAREFVKGITAEFNQANTKLKAALFQGQMTQEQFKIEGQKAAQQFNAGITTGLEKFGAAGILTPEMEAQLVRRYKTAGLEAGAALTEGMVPAVEESAGVFGMMERVGHRSVGNLVSGLTLLSVTAGENASALTKVGHAIEMAGFVLGGPEFGVPIAIGVTLLEQLTESFEKSGKAAEDAAVAYENSLASMNKSGDVIGMMNAKMDAQEQLYRAQGALARTPKPNITYDAKTGLATGTEDGGAYGAAVAAVDEAKHRLDVATGALDSYNRYHPGLGATPPSGGASGSRAGPAADPLKALTDSANTLLSLQPQLAQGWGGLDDLGTKQLGMVAQLTAALAAQTDQYSAQSVALRDLIAKYQQLGVVQLAGGVPMRSASSFMGVTPGNGPAVDSVGNLTMAPIGDSAIAKLNINTAALPSIPSKLDTLGGIFKDAIASQAQFIAQSLVTVLGVRNANTGGAIGSVIGGAVGAGLAKEAIGATAGAVVGSVVPVVGTVIGSIAGGAIGNAIGKLFGGHKTAADNSASALNSLANAAQKLTESLSNVPSGFKVALARFGATSTTSVGQGMYGTPYGLPPGASGGVHVYGPVYLQGVEDASSLYDKLTSESRVRGVRGGTQPLALALKVA